MHPRSKTLGAFFYPMFTKTELLATARQHPIVVILLAALPFVGASFAGKLGEDLYAWTCEAIPAATRATFNSFQSHPWEWVSFLLMVVCFILIFMIWRMRASLLKIGSLSEALSDKTARLNETLLAKERLTERLKEDEFGYNFAEIRLLKVLSETAFIRDANLPGRSQMKQAIIIPAIRKLVELKYVGTGRDPNGVDHGFYITPEGREHLKRYKAPLEQEFR
jgi:DNA-binding MarR family transcriptional regulator